MIHRYFWKIIEQSRLMYFTIPRSKYACASDYDRCGKVSRLFWNTPTFIPVHTIRQVVLHIASKVFRVPSRPRNP